MINNKKYGIGSNLSKIPVPCGKCPECKRSRLHSWTFRIKKELEICTNPLFVTLTYDRKNLPKALNGQPTLDKKDCQLFIKLLRFHHDKISNEPLRYYLVGEYGTLRGRPHYHLILLNLKDNGLIDSTWGRGFTSFSRLSDARLSYTLKYISKPKHQKKEDKLPEFSLMSKGLGKNYLTPQMVKYHNTDIQKNSFILLNGYKIAIPRYYKNKIFDEETLRKLTIHNQARVQYLIEEKACKIQKKTGKPIEEILRSLELSKLNVKFEKQNTSSLTF